MTKTIALGHVDGVSEAQEDWIEPLDKLIGISNRLSLFGCQNIKVSGQRSVEQEALDLDCFEKMGAVSVIRFELPQVGQFLLYWNGFHGQTYVFNQYESGVHLALVSDLPESGNQWVLEAITKHIFNDQVTIKGNIARRNKRPAFRHVEKLLPILLSGERHGMEQPLQFDYIGA